MERECLETRGLGNSSRQPHTADHSTTITYDMETKVSHGMRVMTERLENHVLANNGKLEKELL